VSKDKIDILYDMLKDMRSDKDAVDKELKVLAENDNQKSIRCAIHDRDNQLLFQEIHGIKQDVSEIKGDVDKIKFELVSVSQTLRDNTKSLQEHIAGVNTLKDLHLQNAKRIELLEQPNRAMEFLKSRLVFYSAIVTAISGIIAAIVKFV